LAADLGVVPGGGEDTRSATEVWTLAVSCGGRGAGVEVAGQPGGVALHPDDVSFHVGGAVGPAGDLRPISATRHSAVLELADLAAGRGGVLEVVRSWKAEVASFCARLGRRSVTHHTWLRCTRPHAGLEGGDDVKGPVTGGVKVTVVLQASLP